MLRVGVSGKVRHVHNSTEVITTVAHQVNTEPGSAKKPVSPLAKKNQKPCKHREPALLSPRLPVCGMPKFTRLCCEVVELESEATYSSRMVAMEAEAAATAVASVETTALRPLPSDPLEATSQAATPQLIRIIEGPREGPAALPVSCGNPTIEMFA